MLPVNLKCPDCRTPMEMGFIPDHHHSGAKVTHWVGGKPEKSIWTGLKLRGKKRVPVVAFCCRRCGLIRQYADHS